MSAETSLTILLVDDSTVDRALYRHFLGSTATYTFLEATTGEEGLRLCRTTRPDCLILDFYLPDMDGFAFLDALQTETASLPYPVVMLTGQGSEQLAVQSMHRGVQDYVVKRALAELLDHQPGTGTGTARLLDAALAALVRLDRDDADPGGPATDRPARRRIDLLVEQTIDWAEHAGPEADRESIREAARSLAGQPEFESQGAALLLALARLDASGPDDLVAQLTEVAGLLVDRPALAGLLAGRLVDRVSAGGGNQMASTLAAAADRLTADGGVTTGLFAVGLTRAGAGDGWPQPWPSLLHRLRRHPAPDVRSAAFEVVMA